MMNWQLYRGKLLNQRKVTGNFSLLCASLFCISRYPAVFASVVSRAMSSVCTFFLGFMLLVYILHQNTLQESYPSRWDALLTSVFWC